MSIRIGGASAPLCALALALSACSGDDGPGRSSCVPGRTEACVCPGGAFGVQTCADDGTFGACGCDAPDAGTRPDAGSRPDAGAPGDAGVASQLVGPEGGTVTGAGASLEIPAGALAAPTEIRIRTLTSTPAGTWTLRSEIFALEPLGLRLSLPATLRLPLRDTTEAERAALFLEREGAAGWARVGGTPGADALTASVRRLARVFAADGVRFSEAPDLDCVRTRVLDAIGAPPANVGVAVRAADCLERPIGQLSGSDVRVRENGASVQGAVAELPASSVDLFVSLLVDLEGSTDALLTPIANGLGGLVNRIGQEAQGGVQVGLTVFGAEDRPSTLVPFTLDLARVDARLAALRDSRGSYPGRDPAGANLFSAVRSGLSALDAARSAHATRNAGGIATAGVLVLVTDGRDTVSLDREADRLATLAAAAGSSSEVVVVGVDGGALDLDFVRALGGEDAFVAPSGGSLPRELAAAGERALARLGAVHVFGFCSPSRSGETRVQVEVEGADAPASVASPARFSADGFGEGCSIAELRSPCAGQDCGGLLCGACDDRVAACEVESGACVSHCVAVGTCMGETITNPRGYEQACAPTASWVSCNGSCADTTADFSLGFCAMSCIDVAFDPANCGGCGVMCTGATECAAASCIERWTSWPMPPDAPEPSNYDATAAVVTDRVTGLTWQRVTDGQRRDWLTAKRYCEQLSLGGFSDWRLPSRLELVSLVDYGRVMPAIDDVAFPMASSAVFWSASPRGASTDVAWTVSFVRGNVITSAIAAPNHARCVR